MGEDSVNSHSSKFKCIRGGPNPGTTATEDNQVSTVVGTTPASVGTISRWQWVHGVAGVWKSNDMFHVEAAYGPQGAT